MFSYNISWGATKKEVERFLADRVNNATKAPDMLALIFAALAVGMQIGVFDRSDSRWLEAAMAESHENGKAWRKFPLFLMLSHHPLTCAQSVPVCKRSVTHPS